MNNVIFVNNSNSLNNIEIRDYLSNPGIGGTEYVTVRLIYMLSQILNDVSFYLLTNQNIDVVEGGDRIKIINKMLNCNPLTIICPTSQIGYLETFDITGARIVIWSHHPHDVIRTIKIKNYELISLGKYQYMSNMLEYGKHYLIPNPYREPENKKQINGMPNNYLYFGGINRAKGLHLVLRKWHLVKQENPNAMLHIIGGNLYQEHDEEQVRGVSIGGGYGSVLNEIINKMSPDIQDSLVFHGLLSSGKVDQVLKKIDIALLNPTGKSEAAPASPLECFVFGIPVIAGGDFGMYDIMEDFPELDSMKVNFKEIIRYINNSKNMQVILNRVEMAALDNYRKNNDVIADWRSLFDGELSVVESTGFSLYMKLKIYFRHCLYRYVKYPLKKIMFL